MNKNENGIMIIKGSLFLVLIMIVCSISFYLWQNQKNDNTSNDQQTDTTNTTTADTDIFILKRDMIPVGWVIGLEEQGHIVLYNNDTNCSAEAYESILEGEVNASESERLEQNLDSIRSKGYDVVVSESTMEINTSSGLEKIKSNLVNVTGFDSATYHNMAFISSAHLTITCPNETELKSAENTLLAVEFR